MDAKRSHEDRDTAAAGSRCPRRLRLAALVVGIAILAATGFVVGRSLMPAAAAPLQVRVTGHHGWWEIEYLGDDPSLDFTAANELHLPAGQPAAIELRSDDAMHGFRLQNLSAQRDVTPGRVDRLTLTPRRLGEFRGSCAQVGGIERAAMALLVVVDDPAVFDGWRQRQLAPAAAPASATLRKGEQAFVAAACVLCHEVRGTIAGSHTGPDLTHVGSRRTLAAGALPMNPGALAAWLADPQQVKPGTHMPRVDLGPQRLDDVVSYLSSLK